MSNHFAAHNSSKSYSKNAITSLANKSLFLVKMIVPAFGFLFFSNNILANESFENSDINSISEQWQQACDAGDEAACELYERWLNDESRIDDISFVGDIETFYWFDPMGAGQYDLESLTKMYKALIGEQYDELELEQVFETYEVVAACFSLNYDEKVEIPTNEDALTSEVLDSYVVHLDNYHINDHYQSNLLSNQREPTYRTEYSSLLQTYSNGYIPARHKYKINHEYCQSLVETFKENMRHLEENIIGNNGGHLKGELYIYSDEGAL